MHEMITLHPYQYAYFNKLFGGVRAADSRYMLDYWGLSFKQATDDLLTVLEERGIDTLERRVDATERCVDTKERCIDPRNRGGGTSTHALFGGPVLGSGLLPKAHVRVGRL